MDNLIVCPGCGCNKINSQHFQETFFSPKTKSRYLLFSCPQCALGFWTPRKLIKENYTDWSYYQMFHYQTNRVFDIRAYPFISRMQDKKGRLLDIGCREGLFLSVAQKQGYQVYGIDFDVKSIKVATDQYGLTSVFGMSLDEFSTYAKTQSLTFDVITFFEVLEHQDDPGEFLEQVKLLLSEDGIIAGTVPNCGAPFAPEWILSLAEKTFDYVNHPPHHFLRWNKKALENFFSSHGFECCYIQECVYQGVFSRSRWWAAVLTGNLMVRISSKIKKMISTDAHAETVTLELILTPERSGFCWRCVRFFRKVFELAISILFLPVALIPIRGINNRGENLYFEARKVRKP